MVQLSNPTQSRPRDDIAVLKQQPLALLKVFEPTCRRPSIAAGAHFFCNPAPLIGNSLRAFGYVPTGQI